MSADANLPPDFVILGVPRPDGTVVVYGSTSLTEATIHQEATYDEDRWGNIRQPSRRHIDVYLSGHMHGIVRVEGPDYPTALRRLLETWEPTNSTMAPQLHESARELHGGR